MNVSMFAVILIGLFVIGMMAIVAVIAFGIFSNARDKRTMDERRADEYGDMRTGNFKITPGMGGDVDGGAGSL